MKKLLLIGFAFFLSPSGLPVNTAQAQTSTETTYSSYWDYYRNYYSNSRYSTARSYRPTYRTTPRRTSAPRVSNSTRSTRYNTNRRTSNYQIYSTNRNSRAVSANAVKATVTPITLRQDINDITNAPVDLFQIGLSYPGGSSTTFSPAAQIRQMQFKIQDNSGAVSDFSDFDLLVEDQNFQFEQNGYITLDFGNLRLARGESRALNVQIRLNDPDSFARLPGSFRVKLNDISATQEGSVQGIETQITGRTVSDYVVLNPTPSVSGGGANGTASGSPVFIAGRALGAGEKATVLSARLEASKDDFLIERVTVHNAYGSNIDSLVQEVRLLNLNTGQTLSTKRFTGGSATFDLSSQNQVFIARNNEVTLAFEVLVRDNLPSSMPDNRIELGFAASDIDVFGIGAGQNVPNSSKNFNLDSETFTVNQGGGGTAVGGINFSATQPSFVSNGSLDQIVRFQVRNAGSGGMSLGRITVQALPAGVEYTGGISLDDAKLVRVLGGFQEYSSGFNTTAASSSTFTFDTSSEVYLAPGEVQEYGLKLRLSNIGDYSDSDSVAVKILGDSSFLNATTLAGQRGNNANFIWSDQSGSPHGVTSSDWLSGYLVSGLPTNNFVKYRR